jgi:hypothetical protein
MMQDTTLRGRCRSGRRGAGPAVRALAFLGLLVLGACAGGTGQPGQSGAIQAAAPAPPADPIVAFAARAQPGAESRVVLADGRPATVRLLRSYHAASGRECREVVVGAGTAQRTQVVCQAEGGTWAAARPLLRGGGAARP